MIDLKQLIENPENIQKALLKKHFHGDLGEIRKIYGEKLGLMQEMEKMKAAQNSISKEIATASKEEKEKLLQESKEIKENLKKMEPELAALEAKMEEVAMTIPNPPSETVPEGKDDTENVVIKTYGKKPAFDFEPVDHIALGKKLDIIDMETAGNVSGTRFYYLKNDAVLLEFALIQFVINKLVSKGFSPIIPPILVKERAMIATGFFPADRNEIYHVNPSEDDLYLVGTSEVPLCMLHADQIIQGEKLPLRYMGFSSCFRREAGSYGKDTHGMIRVHQFDKIEMFSFCHPTESIDEHELILAIEEEIMQDLGFHYQVLNICGGDLGTPAAKKYDIEVWIPTQGKFRELTSCSNCTDFQSRRAQIRYRQQTTEKGKDGQPVQREEKQLVHTLNGTAIALARTLVAVIENYQQKDGSILIPKVLQPYMGGRTRIEAK